jgi:phosphate transport system permease protein
MTDQPRSLTGAPPLAERLIEAALAGCAALSLLTSAAIVLVLAQETFAFFHAVPLTSFLFDTEWTPLFERARFGIWPLVCGTALTAAVALLVAGPLGLLAAIYLAEFASPRARDRLKPMIEVLAGIPTLVYGYFALRVVTPWLALVIPGLQGFNALSAGLVMGLMILPTVCSLGEDALHAVPQSLREGAVALGAGRLATLFLIVVPAARSGLLAAMTLGLSRALGETMIVAIAAGQQARLTLDPRGPVETMSAYIVQISLGDAAAGTVAYRTIFAVGAALFALTFATNAAAQRWIARARRVG